MATTLQAPVPAVGSGVSMSTAEYLRTMFHPDREYVDGLAEERNLGEYEHGKVQSRIWLLLQNHEAEWGIDVNIECRLQVSADRFRIPDVMVLPAGLKVDRYPTTAPLICIEVLSPEDTWKRLRGVVDDYFAMGVEHVWAFDPQMREAFVCDRLGFHKVTELAVVGTAIRLDLQEVFSVLR